MAISAATVWRVRPGGNDANGAGYDSSISGAGTDYSQQDAAQLSLTDLVCQASDDATRLKLRSATGGFTSAMIGNAIRILSTGTFTAGYYFIVGYDSTNLVTLDRSPAGGADRTGGSGKVGGAAATPWQIDDDGNATGNKCVPGNKIYIRGSGSRYPTTADYTKSSTYTNVQGDTTSGYVSWIGENGRPRISMGGNGYVSWQRGHRAYISLYLTRSAAQADEGVVSGSGTNVLIYDCVINGGDQNGPCLRLGRANLCIGNDIFCHASAPTSGANRRGIVMSGFDVWIGFNRIHHCGDDGIEFQGTGTALFNVIDHCKGNGIQIVNHSGDNNQIALVGNTIDANEGHGIDIASGQATITQIVNNIISNHTGSGKYGVNAAGTTATNDRLLQLVDRNAFYNNTGHRNGVSAGPNDIDGTDPSYTSASTGDYRIGTALKALGLNVNDFSDASGARTFLDIGAMQREEAGGAGAGGAHIMGGTVVR